MKMRGSTVRSDLEWAYNRLDHLLTIYEEGCIASSDFDGPHETMGAIKKILPELRRRYGFKQAWPSGRCEKDRERVSAKRWMCRAVIQQGISESV